MIGVHAKQALLCLLIILSIVDNIYGQVKLNGFVYDGETKEGLTGAVVYVSNTKGTVTNNSGYFILPISREDSVIHIRMMGYKPWKQAIKGINTDSILITFLDSGTRELKEIEITGDQIWHNTDFDQNIIDIPLQQAKGFPTLAGEPDPIKFLQSLPGITPGREGRSDLHVRGGSPDQNLFLIDNMPLYSIQHLGGLLSILDPNSLKSLKVYKGGFPAKYGGRLSSVVDVQLKDGDKTSWHKHVDIGIVAARFAIEGPLKPDTSSIFFSARRSNLDIFTSISSLLSSDGQFRTGYNFYDFVGKANIRQSAKNKYSITMYGGLDNVYAIGRKKDEVEGVQQQFRNKSSINWLNLMSVFNWDHVGKNKIFRNVMMGFSRFQLSNGFFLESQNIESDTLINQLQNEFFGFAWDIRGGLNYEAVLRNNLILSYGIQSSFQRFLPGSFQQRQFGENLTNIDQQYGAEKRDIVEISGYADLEIIFGKWLLHPGVRYVYWPNIYNAPHLEPRLTVSYREGIHAFNFSFDNMRQSMHLLSHNSAGAPMDLWVPAITEVPPMQTSIFALGYARSTENNLVQLGSYFKTYSNVIEFQQGKSFFGDQLTWDEKIIKGGIGQSYGFELLYKKKMGRLNGWISYTYSRSLRRFSEIDDNEWFPYRYDRPHNGSVFINYELKETVLFSANWMYASGDAITLPIGKYPLNTYGLTDDYILTYGLFPVHLYGKRNSFRVPATHRLDINFSFIKQKKKSTRTFKVGVYNLYNRLNPYYIYLDKNDNGQIKFYKAALLPFFPFISWSFTF